MFADTQTIIHLLLSALVASSLFVERSGRLKNQD